MPSQAVLELLVELKDQASSGLDSLGGALKTVGGIAGGVALAGVAAFGAAVVSGVGDAREANQIMAQTQAVIKSTGGAAGFTADQIADMAGQLSAASGQSLFGDSDIQKGQNLLLTFTNITETLPDATKTMVDMAQALGTDVSGGAIQLGKALNDPIAGISALSRVGVTFTEEQKAQIKAMQEAGNTAGAQKIILAELNKEFGGSAQAAADADGGWAQFNDRLGEAKETLGAAVLPILTTVVGFLNDSLMPAVEAGAAAFAAWLSDPAVQAGIQQIGDAITTGLGVAFDFIANTAIPALLSAWAFIQPAIAAILPLFQGDMPSALGSTSQTFTILQATINTVMAGIMAIVGAILPVVAAFWKENGESIMAFVTQAWDTIMEIIGTALKLIAAIVGPALQFIAKFITDHGAEIQRIMTNVWESLRAIIDGALTIIQGVLKAALQIVQGDWSGAWETIKAALSRVWDDIKVVIESAWDTIKTLFGGFVSDAIGFGKDLIDGIVQGVKDAASSLTSALVDMATSALDAAKDALGISSPSKAFMEVGRFSVLGMIEGFANEWPAMESTIQSFGDKMIAKAADVAKSAQQALASAFGATASIDRQMADNLDKLADVKRQFDRDWITQNLETIQKTAQTYADPKVGAQYFKMMSDQLFETQKIRDQIAEATSEDEKKRLEEQLILISRAQEAELAAFQASQAGAASPLQAIASQIQAIIGALPGTNQTDAQITLMGALQTLVDQLTNAQHRALGGPVAAGQGYWVGERGPEYFRPGTSGAIVPNGAGGVVFNNTFNLPPGTTQQLVDMVMARMNQQMKGRR